MAATSKMIELGTPAQNFELTHVVSEEKLTLDDIRSDKATVIMFICNHCPYVIHILDGLVKLTDEYIDKGISFAAISSNDVVNYPEDSPGKMKEIALKKNFKFPYLYDESQEVAKKYGAECTPDIFVFDKDLKLVYRGQFDDSRPKNDIPVTGKDLRNALDSILNGEPVDQNQIPSIGCSIKWKK
ncbi:MAG: thioredoxin family protein [Melioribacteraceae bacterium]|nr:thioredoxin family protein [Melioribacteraceae bacterium]